MGGGDNRQIQGAKGKSMLVGRTESRHEYLEGEAHSLRRVNYSNYVLCHILMENSFLTDVLQACWLFSVCTAFKVQKTEIITVSESLTHSKPFSKGFYRFVVYLLINWFILQCSFISRLFVSCVITGRCE